MKKTRGGIKDGQPLKDKTVADIKAIVHQILVWANKNNKLDQIPICPTISVRQKSNEVLTIQEQSMLEAQLIKENTPFCLGIWLSLYGGLRIGEACAMKWEDIDFTNGTVRINKTVNRIIDVSSGNPSGTKVIVSSPKTECSLRTIPLPETILSYFKERKNPVSDLS